MVRQINTKHELELELERAGNNLVVLEFFKTRSPQSKRLLPKLEDEKTKRSDVLLFKVNVDMLPEVAALYGILETPAVVYIKNGQKVHSIVGPDLDAMKGAIALFAGEERKRDQARAATAASRG